MLRPKEQSNDSSMNVSLLAWTVCILGALFYSYEYFLRIAPSVMTNELMRGYHINGASLGNLSAFYYYIYVPMQIPAGLLMDRYGPRMLLTYATFSCALGSLLFGLTGHLSVAELGRFLVGFGSAFAFVGVLKLATIWLPTRYFALFAGAATTLGMIGASIGDNVMAYMVGVFGWHQTVFISAFLGIILAILIYVIVRNQPEGGPVYTKQKIDLKGLKVGFFRVAMNPQMWVLGVIGALLYLPTSAFAEMWGNPFLMQSLHFSAGEAAFATSMIFIGWAIGAPIAGFISDTIKRRVLPLFVGSLLASALISIVLFVHTLSPMMVAGIFLVFGIVSGVEVIVFALGREFCSLKMTGTALAFTNMLVMAAGMLFQPIIGMFLDAGWTGKVNQHGVHIFSATDYHTALLVMPIGLLLAAMLSLFALKETYAKPLVKG